MPDVEERMMGSRLQSSGCTIYATVATLILRPISSQLPDGTGTLGNGDREVSIHAFRGRPAFPEQHHGFMGFRAGVSEGARGSPQM